MDIGIKSFKDNMLTVGNLGGRPMPFIIKVNNDDETFLLEEVSPVVWQDTPTYIKRFDAKKKITSVEIKVLDNGDVEGGNNSLQLKSK
jgi:hypothetical protein